MAGDHQFPSTREVQGSCVTFRDGGRRISSAVLSTTQPPLRNDGGKSRSARYVSTVTRGNKGVDSWRQRALSAASLV
jgi:hypothetical protein